MLLLALAIAPGFAICIYIFYRDRYNHEPASTLLVSFLWGVLSTVPAVIIELATQKLSVKSAQGIIFSSFFFIALVEEFCKFLPLRYYSMTRRSFDEPLDGIVHAVMIAMGFATLENIGYVFGSKSGGLDIALKRMFTAVPGHACFGIIMGFFVGKAKFNPQRRNILLLTGLFLASFFHGTYDSFAFLSDFFEEQSGGLLMAYGVLSTLLIAIFVSLMLIRFHKRKSKKFYINPPVLTIKNATIKDIPLIRTLAQQIWPAAYTKIISKNQIRYMMELIYSKGELHKQMENKHQFLLVYNTGLPVGFASVSEIEPAIYKLHKLYVLPSQQGKGTGKFVLEQVIADIKSKKATALRLNVNRNNKAKVFYEKLGFEVVRTEDIDIGHGYFMNDYVMEKKIENKD